MNAALRLSFNFLRRASAVRLGAACLLLMMLSGLPVVLSGADEPLRACVIGATDSTAASLDLLKSALAQIPGIQTTVIATTGRMGSGPELGALRSAHVAVFHRGPGPLGAEDAALLREFMGAGKGCVILGASPEAWTAMPGFFPEVLGATPGDRFAKGAPMTVINLFPHPIYAGVARFETSQAMPAYTKLEDDLQLVMEGTVGEETAPLAWVRRRAAGRICHLVPAEPATLRDPACQRIVANAVRWTAGRPIPDARPAVQRTFMPDAYPGAFAITFPEGTGVCLDPVRGGITYIWDGDFVDLRPRWLTKQGAPARIFGEIFYQEKLWQPLRLGAPGSEPKFEFRGYTLHDGVPEFHYQIDGRDVYETISALAEGKGITRRFRVGPGKGALWINLEPQSGADMSARGVERDGNSCCFASHAAGEFTIEIRRKERGKP